MNWPLFRNISLCAAFQFGISNQISLYSRVLDQLAEAKAKRKRRETRVKEEKREGRIRISVIRPTFASLMPGRSSNLTRRN